MSSSTRGQPNFAGLPLEAALEHAQIFVSDNDNVDLIMKTVDALLAAVACSNCGGDRAGTQVVPTDPNQVLKSIANLVRDLTFQHLNVRHILLAHLSTIPDPIAFIEIVPQIFSIESTPSLIEEVVGQLRELLELDNRLLLPVIGAMADLPLPRSASAVLCELAEVAVTSVDEEDWPVLFRMLLKSIHLVDSQQITLRLRREVGSLSNESIALVVEAMWEVLPSSVTAAGMFLQQIVHEQEVLELNVEPSLADLAAILILTADVIELRTQARALLEIWLWRGAFPFTQLKLILNLRRTNEVRRWPSRHH